MNGRVFRRDDRPSSHKPFVAARVDVGGVLLSLDHGGDGPNVQVRLSPTQAAELDREIRRALVALTGPGPEGDAS
jgi:hypothetical protein